MKIYRKLENKKHWFFIFAFLLLASCSESATPSPTNSPAPLPTPTNIPTKALNSEEEYEIYDAVINLKYTQIDELIIADQTRIYRVAYQELGFLAEAEDAYRNFLSRNEQSSQLENRFSPYGTEVLLVDNDYLNNYFDGGEDLDLEWRNFHEAHQNSYGYLHFSRVGVNAQIDKAIVYVEFHCGGTCGSGTVYLLSKVDSTWKIIADDTLFNA